jgi:CheY-like chemotaxis protein/two-component sensor histidine kinase
MLQKEATIIAKDRFFSDISHDMRTPLNAILGFSNLARRQGLSNTDKDKYLAKIQASGKLLLDLVNDTLTVSRANSGKLVLRTAPVATEDLIDSIIEPIRIIAQEKNITLDLNTAAYRPRIIVADRLNVQKIMLNILTNAVKYTPCGGHIWVTVADESVEGNQSWLIFTVHDDGIGMAPEFIEHIYEPFAQEQRKGYEGMGTGLGLAIVKHLVDLMQGRIAIDSQINKGTTFTVQLHFEEATVELQSDKIVTSPRDEEWMRGKRVLLCEDNRLNSEIVTEYLGLYGIAVDCAENGKVGVARFSKSITDTYCAILMDIRMPVMDGFEATKLIRSLNRPDASTIPIIAVTADVLNDNIRDCLKTGMNGYISKPVDPQIMIEVLSKHVH